MKSKNTLFLKLLFGIFAILFLVVIAEGLYYWKNFSKLPGIGVQKEPKGEQGDRFQTVRSEEDPLIYEVVQGDGSKEINVLGQVKEVNKEKSYLQVENEGSERKVFVSGETRFLFMSNKTEGGTIPNVIGQEGLEKILAGMNINVYLFYEIDEGIAAEAIMVF